MTNRTPAGVRKKVISCGTVPCRLRGVTEVLLVRPFEEVDVWGIPKGHLHDGETFEECAVRETLEETGILVSPYKRLVDVYAKYRYEDKTVVSYLAHQLCDSEPKIQEEELVDAKWFPIDKLPRVHAYQLPLIKHALLELETHSVRKILR